LQRLVRVRLQRLRRLPSHGQPKERTPFLLQQVQLLEGQPAAQHRQQQQQQRLPSGHPQRLELARQLLQGWPLPSVQVSCLV
jgi:hypothetical protein